MKLLICTEYDSACIAHRQVKEPVSKEDAAKQEKLRLQAAAYAAKRDMGLMGEPSKP